MKLLRYTFYTLAILIVLALVYYRVWFLRQPDRTIPYSEKVFVSPANGVVVSVNKWNADILAVKKGDMGLINVWTQDVDTAGTIISIQMDPANVHYQRAPHDSKVIAEKYTKGSFNNAIVMSNEYGIRFENEHNEMLFENADGKRYKVVQLAGFLARRIEDYVKPEQQVKQGEVIGLIKLGSQVTILLPNGVEPNVKVGETLIDGESIIGKYPQ